jgi:hypothetical protein
MGCFFFHRVCHVKKGKGTRKMLPFLYFTLYIGSLKNFMKIIRFTLGMSFCVPLNDDKKINSTAK